MDYSASRVKQDYGSTGILYDLGSVYEGISKIPDKRKARGKIYQLETILMIIVLAKLSGEDKPRGIAEWGKHHGAELVKLMQLKKTQMPSLNTYRRILAEVVCQEALERMVGTYNQAGKHGKVYGLDGKAVRGMRKQDEEDWREYMLSVYDVDQRKVLSQVEVGRKENEITKAPKALDCVEISQKVVTGDALHTQKALSAQIVRQGGDYIFPVKENQLSLYKNIQQLFAPEYPKAGFGKIETDFQTVAKVNKGHGRLEKRTLTTSEMLNSYSTWPGLAQVYRLERQFQWWRSGRCYRTSCAVEFGITSLSRSKTTPENLLRFRREHWGIETGLHYRRDVTFHEDATHMTIGNTGKNMASINNLVIALSYQAGFQNAAQARRFFSANLPKAFTLLTTPFS